MSNQRVMWVIVTAGGVMIFTFTMLFIFKKFLKMGVLPHSPPKENTAIKYVHHQRNRYAAYCQYLLLI